MNKICAIHQPNFFPWLGYFNKIQQADYFIFLDEVAYPKSGSGSGSWCNRSKVIVSGEAKWLGCPIRREHGVQLIKDVKIDDCQPWRKKMLKTLELNYRKTKNYDEAMALLKPLILFDSDSLCEFNINAITTLTNFLNQQVEFVRQSALNVDGNANVLLVNITKKVNAASYLCGGGAGGYQDDDYFAENDINLIYQNYQPSAYDQNNSHLLGLSVIDYIMKR